jgi:hypothetical protein
LSLQEQGEFCFELGAVLVEKWSSFLIPHSSGLGPRASGLVGKRERGKEKKRKRGKEEKRERVCGKESA